jgi:hypothetical protein
MTEWFGVGRASMRFDQPLAFFTIPRVDTGSWQQAVADQGGSDCLSGKILLMSAPFSGPRTGPPRVHDVRITDQIGIARAIAGDKSKRLSLAGAILTTSGTYSGRAFSDRQHRRKRGFPMRAAGARVLRPIDPRGAAMPKFLSPLWDWPRSSAQACFARLVND